MVNATKEDIFNYTDQQLTHHFENNEEFRNDFAVLYNFYRSKFNDIILENDQDEFDNMLFQSIKSQFFNGYFIIREFIEHEESVLSNEWLTQPDGILTEQIPELIRGLTAENDEAIITEDMHELIIWTITRYENVRRTLRQIAFDIVCLGAKQALLDERKVKGLEPFETTLNGLLSKLDDIHFLTPQVFLSPAEKTTEVEMWNLNWWSSIEQENNKAGEVIIISTSVSNKKNYVLNIYLKKEFSSNEQQQLLDIITFNLMDRNNIPRKNININFAVVDDFYFIVQE